MPGINVNSESVKYTLKNYSYLINNFIQINGFSDKKIENEELTFLIVKSSYKELSNIDDETIDNIKNIRKNENYEYIRYYYYILDDLCNEAAAFYVDETHLIVINYQKIETNLEFISTILGEYNHYLIDKNLQDKNISKYYGNDVCTIFWSPIHYIDESITAFYGLIFEMLIKNKDISALNNTDLMITIVDLDRYIYNTNSDLTSYFRTMEKSIKFISFKDIYAGYPSFVGWPLLILYYDSLLPTIVDCYGYEYIYSLIKYLYSSKYYSFEQIINDVFSDSSENFIKHWEDRVKLIMKLL